MAEYGALTSGEVWTDLSGSFGKIVDFLQTPQGILLAVVFFLLILYVSRNNKR